MDLKRHIRHVPDFPKAGILFYDITTLLRDPQGLSKTVDVLATPYEGKGIDTVIGIESRGFILGAAVAQRIGAGFVPKIFRPDLADEIEAMMTEDFDQRVVAFDEAAAAHYADIVVRRERAGRPISTADAT